MDVERRANDVAHALARIERGERILEDDLHAPAERTQCGSSQAGNALAREGYGAACGFDEPHQRKPGG